MAAVFFSAAASSGISATALAVCLHHQEKPSGVRPLLRIDRFSYGYLFSLTMALVRFQSAH